MGEREINKEKDRWIGESKGKRKMIRGESDKQSQQGTKRGSRVESRLFEQRFQCKQTITLTAYIVKK